MDTDIDTIDLIKRNNEREKKYHFQSDTGDVHFTSYALNNQIIINWANGYSKQDTFLTEEQKDSFFVLFFQINGSSENHGFQEKLLQGTSGSAFYYFHRKGNMNFLKGDNIKFLTVMIRPDFLIDKILDSNAISASLKKSIDMLTINTTLLAHSIFGFKIQTLLNDIINCPYHNTIKQLYLEGKFFELIALYFDELDKEQANLSIKGLNQADLSKIRDAKAYLDTVFHDPPGLIELSRLMGFNEYKLKKGFKELFGMTVFDYIRQLRMEKGKKLLLEGNKNITEISYQVGYNNPGNFSRNFKKQFGISPGKLK